MILVNRNIYILLVVFISLTSTKASIGDRTDFFANCCRHCERQNCTADGVNIQEQAIKYYKQSIFDQLFQWTCSDECKYACMWRTAEAFVERGWQVPQFFGKWPFIKILGMQEPASVLFSAINLLVHVKMIRKFRREVRSDSPCYILWHIFAAIFINGWIWSIIFHTRDFPLTELLDYAFAYSLVLCSMYCMVYRMIYNYSIILRGLVTLVFLSYFFNYFAYLSIGQFSYSYNMIVNIMTGCIAAAGWLIWSFFVRKRRPYCKQIVRFCVLSALCLCLEMLDFPPLLWSFDAHALWHLSTAPIAVIFYDFTIADCQALRKERLIEAENKIL